ncbi:SDR family NAD(P)-dependent oxidoreductase [Hahella sp. CCB-MM4]|uniref:SDR family NAD(P)-dependent oxidoreductase n=1 Tax=Hahella sp. (strain CCB-MM4) TaxID=1926491 RepID=UPI00143CDA73|nr:SDR family NAD(P)-dependent oxidoreductase [Hahella sp. CCB-MM4]
MSEYVVGYGFVPVVAVLRRLRVVELLLSPAKYTAPRLAAELGLDLIRFIQLTDFLISQGCLGTDQNNCLTLHISPERMAQLEQWLTLYRIDFDSALSAAQRESEDTDVVISFVSRVLTELDDKPSEGDAYSHAALLLPLFCYVSRHWVQVLNDGIHHISIGLTHSGQKDLLERLILKVGWAKPDGNNLVMTDTGIDLYQQMAAGDEEIGLAGQYLLLDEFLQNDSSQIKPPDHLPVFPGNHQNPSFNTEHALQALGEALKVTQEDEEGSGPKVIVDCYCGDGSMLAWISSFLKENGSKSESLPLLVGVNNNAKDLERAGSLLTQQGVDHLLLQPGKADLFSIKQELESRKLYKEDEILFIDHLPGYSRIGFNHAGRVEQWKAVGGHHGVICIASFSVKQSHDSPSLQHIKQQSVLSRMNTLVAIDRQHSISAWDLLVTAAQRQMFCDREIWRGYPEDSRLTTQAVCHFRHAPYAVRLATLEDLDELYQLEQLCWTDHLQVTRHNLLQRLSYCREGNWLLTIDSKIAGVVYSQRIQSPDDVHQGDYINAYRIHRDGAPITQLIALNVLPQYREMGIGDKLLSGALLISMSDDRIAKVCAVTRCTAFTGTNEAQLEQYVMSEGDAVDPLVTFHRGHGAQVRGLVKGFRPQDKQNLGTGVLIEYDLLALGRKDNRQLVTGTVNLDAAALSEIIKSEVLDLTGNQQGTGYAHSRPLKDMGIDSMALMQLRNRINKAIGSNIPPTFFFKHGSVEEIVENLARSKSPSESSVKKDVKPEAEPIAIIGMSCRFPGQVDSPQQLWQLLSEGGDAIGQVPDGIARQYLTKNSLTNLHGGFLDQVDLFDGAFFQVTPREAEYLDPQQRLLLEQSWLALEDAGIDPEDLKKRPIGVFTGIFTHDYELLQNRYSENSGGGIYYATGNSSSTAAGRIAYTFGFMGPTLSVDTACSSSMTALHLACQSLKNDECEAALVSGVNLILSPELTNAFAGAGMLAKDGRCKVFDHQANGYVRSEGCAVIVLKRLSQAQKDGDNILAVIRGSAVNQDGRSNGLTSPNGLAQRQVIHSALTAAGIEPHQVSYVEMHGTGTRLGDPIEIEALNDVYGETKNSPRDKNMLIGSVKANIGHTEAVAGLAGLIKVVMAIQHRELPPQIHYHTRNEQITSLTGLTILGKNASPWQETKLIAGISSFGFSGTNVHVIVEEAPRAKRKQPGKQQDNVNRPAGGYLLKLSARTPKSLNRLIQEYQAFLTREESRSMDLADICFSAAVNRADFEFRRCFHGNSREDLTSKLRPADSIKSPDSSIQLQCFFESVPTHSSTSFPGKNLYDNQSEFKQCLDQCAQYLKDWFEVPLTQALWGENQLPMSDYSYRLPAWCSIQLAQFALFKELGVIPQGTQAEGLGWFAAANAAGVISLEDTLDLVCELGEMLDHNELLSEDCSYLKVLHKVSFNKPQIELNTADSAQEPTFWENLASSAGQWLSLSNPIRNWSTSTYTHGLSLGVMPRLHDLRSLNNSTDQSQSERIDNEIRQLYSLVAELYHSGVDINWRALLSGSGNFVDIPKYQFDRSSYWFTADSNNVRQPESRTNRIDPETSSARHWPLQFIGTDKDQARQYKLQFSGAEYYLKDHVVSGRKVLPAAAYVSIIVRQAMIMSGVGEMSLRGVRWLKPFVAENDQQILYLNINGDLSTPLGFIFSNGAGRFAEGKIEFRKSPKKDLEVLGLDTIRRRCSQHLTFSDCYQRLKNKGFSYGEKLRPIDHLKIGDGEGLAQLNLPEDLQFSINPAMGLPPALIDGALQTCLLIEGQRSNDQYLPYQVEEFALYRPLTAECLVHVRHISGNALNSRLKQFDVDISDRRGQILASLKSLTICLKESSKDQLPSATLAGLHQVLWRDQSMVSEKVGKLGSQVLLTFMQQDAAESLHDAVTDLGSRMKRHVMAVPGEEYSRVTDDRFTLDFSNESHVIRLVDELKNTGLLPDLTIFSPSISPSSPKSVDEGANEETIVSGLDKSFYPVMLWFKSRLAHPAEAACKTLFLYEQSTSLESCYFSSLSGFARALHNENPRQLLKTVAVAAPNEAGVERVTQWLSTELGGGEEWDFEVRYRHDLREVSYLHSVNEANENNLSSPLSASDANVGGLVFSTYGVIIVTGGLGGLGQVFAKYFSGRFQGPVVLLGRSPLKGEKGRLFDELQDQGVKIAYFCCDISDHDSVRETLHQIRQKYGDIKGVVHAAGLNRDAFLINKTRDHSEQVLAPKVAGTQWLDFHTRRDPLEFFICFSSFVGVLGNTGQTDYAFANSFMDHFCAYREELRQKDQRQGRTYSIGWPLWAEGGMQVAPNVLAYLDDWLGMPPLATSQGLFAFGEMLANEPGHYLLFNAREHKLHKAFSKSLDHESLEISHPPSSSNEYADSSPDKNKESESMKSSQISESAALEYLKKQLADVTKLPLDRIRVNAGFDEYGIDSIMITDLNRQLESDLGPMSKTLFFEYRSLQELAGYITQNHGQALEKLLGSHSSPENVSHLEINNDVSQVSVNIDESGLTPDQSDLTDIAIIGVSGRYPDAENLDQFWDNLCNGRDSIIEVPRQRWDWRDYENPSEQQQGSICKWGGFIDDVDCFDPLFFNISPKEARLIDPQERLFLQIAEHTLQDSGYTKQSLNEQVVGVYVGAMYSHYQLFENEKSQRGGAFFAAIANRVSYHYNFNGPSMTLDSMCSSSLSAIHLACNSIAMGDCDIALAGGVNLSLHPWKYQLLTKDRFISSDGRCRSFGTGGDGYVPGEGVGAVLLKPLKKAIEDRDHIHAVIKGSAVNHGGKTNGFTVPNPVAQGQLISAALEKAGVPASSISYVEAHGTGTALGDPIEINGLERAFTRQEQGVAHQQEKSVPIGSVKSNIGHLESAAGMAALTKVLLQLKHKKIVPSLHSSELNGNIDWQKTRFKPQQTLEPWHIADGIQNGEHAPYSPFSPYSPYPRRAAISSFGAGGANAHLIIEEYTPRDDIQLETQVVQPTTQLFVISALREAQLNEYVRNICDFITANAGAFSSPQKFAQLAYNLQTGRPELDRRLAVVAENVDQLLTGLNDFLNRTLQDSGNYLAGQIGETTTPVSKRNRPSQETVLWEIAQKWIKGEFVEWGDLHQGKQYAKTSLPLYPFARDRYWISQSLPQAGNARGGRFPLLDNMNPTQSMDHGVVFDKLLTINLPLIRDHRVGGDFMLAGTAQVEMVAEALAKLEVTSKYRISQMVWLRPLVVTDSNPLVHIALDFTGNEGTFQFYTFESEKKILHSQGRLQANIVSEQDISHFDIEEIRRRLSNVIDPSLLYPQFASNGLEYGPLFSTIESLASSDQEALAVLTVPEDAEGHSGDYQLSPSLLDGALQMIAGMQDQQKGPLLPFSIGGIKQFKSLNSSCIGYVREDGSGQYTAFLLDQAGQLCVRITDICLRKSKDKLSKFFYSPHWRPAAHHSEPADRGIQTTSHQNVWLIYPENAAGLAESIARQHQDDRVSRIQLSDQSSRLDENTWLLGVNDPVSLELLLSEIDSPEMIYFLGGCWNSPKDTLNEIEKIELSQRFGVRMLYRVAGFLGRHHSQVPLSLKVITGNSIKVAEEFSSNPYGASCHGFARSLSREFPRWRLSIIDTDLDAGSTEGIARQVKEDNAYSGKLVAFRQGTKFEQHLIPSPLPGDSGEMHQYKHRGVYLILGGLGGIGLAFSRYLAQHFSARLILIGRSPLSGEKQEAVAELEKLGAEVLYLQADACDEYSMKAAVAKAAGHFGNINGAVHSAIVLQDRSVVSMDEEQLLSALDPKVKGLGILHQALVAHQLDFMLIFSSAQSFWGNAGQSNYAAGCAFKDAYSNYLNDLEPYPVKVINWGYWGEVGIVSTQAYRDRLAAQGILSISTPDGIRAISRVLACAHSQVVAINATEKFLSPLITGLGTVSSASPPEPDSISDEQSLLRVLSPDLLTTRADTLFVQRQTLQDKALISALPPVLLSVFQSMGVFQVAEQTWSMVELTQRLELSSDHGQLFGELLNILVQGGYLERTSAGFTTSALVADSNLQKTEVSALDKLLTSYPDLIPHVKLLKHCLSQYPEILTGRVAASNVMFPNASLHLVEGIYNGNQQADHCNQLVAASVVRYLKGRLDSRDSGPKIRILEIGAGTGGTSRSVLEAIAPFSEHIQYFYTDISLAFTKHGRKTFGDQYSFVEFSLFNVDQPIDGQGIEPGTLDLILATNVIHATRNIGRSLVHIKSLLLSDGWLILNELTAAQSPYTMTFGLLPGWWLFDDKQARIPGSPLLSSAGWRHQLELAGFKDSVVVQPLPSSGEDFGQNVIIAENSSITISGRPIFQASSHTPRDYSKTTYAGDASTGISDVATRLKQLTAAVLELKEDDLSDDKGFADYGVDSIIGVELVNQINDAFGINLKTTVIFDYPNIRGLAHYLVTENIADFASSEGDVIGEQVPSTSDSHEIVQKLKALVASAMEMSTQDVSEDKGFADYGVDSITGVELVNRVNDEFGVSLKTTAIFDYPDIRRLAGHLLSTEEITPQKPTKPPNPSSPLSTLQPGRQSAPIESSVANKVSTSVINETNLEETILPVNGNSRVLITRPGNIANISLAPLSIGEPGPEEVQVEVRAFSLNFGDLLCVRGLYPTMPEYPFTPGFEVAGVVRKIGENVSNVSIGDAVIALTGSELGGHAHLVNSPASLVVSKPEEVSFEEACAFPVVFLTIHHIFKSVMMHPGEKILIQTATGGTGLIAVQLALQAGLEVYATAGSVAKLDYLKKMGVSRVINYRETDFAEQVMEMTAGKGVDIVINTLAGDAIQKGINCLAYGGRYVEIAMTGLRGATSIDLSKMNDNQSFHSIDLRKMLLRGSTAIPGYLDEMSQYLRESRITPTVSQVFDFEKIKQAYRYLENRENIGKAVVRCQPILARPLAEFSDTTGLSGVSGDDEVAVIGFACQFPGARDAEQFWRNLAQGVDSVREIKHWREGSLASPPARNGGIIDNAAVFDAEFFNMSPQDALQTDPQQRLFLQQSYLALEQAGYAKTAEEALSCGVFVGITGGDYDDLLKAGTEPMSAASFWGNETSVAPSRIAYHLNLSGPCLAIDAACASSLAAIHLACQSIRNGQCDMSLAGGVFLSHTGEFYEKCDAAGLLSKQGRCRPFDNSADGFVPGEGVGAVVLKRKSQAIADGDRIIAVIQGSGLNQNGRSNGITAPNAKAQANLLNAVYARHNIDPATIGYVETHGAGTRFGDSLEVEALISAFGDLPPGSCSIGSVKSNIGHAAIAAGMASFIKILLAMEHRQLPPTIHFSEANSLIDFAGSPFSVNQELREWETKPGCPRRAAISAFGFNGSNAHLVLEQYEAISRTRYQERPQHLIVLSARGPVQLRQQAKNLVTYIHSARHNERKFRLDSLAYTLQVNRQQMPERLAVIVSSVDQLEKELSAYASGHNSEVMVKSDWVRQDTTMFLGERQLLELATRWLEGAVMDWNKLYPADAPEKIALPGYPFNGKEYWPGKNFEQDDPFTEASLPEYIAAESRFAEEVSAPESVAEDSQLIRLLTELGNDELSLEDALSQLDTLVID